MFICKHEVQYYETDRMGITHHSNIKLMMKRRELFSKRDRLVL